MSIVFGICCWIPEKSQLPELKRCLESVKNYPVFLINGKWYDIEGDYPTSIPEAVSLIDSYPNVTRINYANHHEWESRNMYLEQCTANDCLIILDTDEYIEITGFFECNILDTPMFRLHVEDPRIGGTDYQKRGVRWPHLTRHRDRHNQLWYKDKEIWSNVGESTPEGIIIYHDKTYRSEKIKEAMKKRNYLRPFR